jgi:hypothetical protein
MAEGNAYILSESFDWYKPVGGQNDEFEAAIIGWSYPKGRAKTGTYAVGVFNDEAARYSTKYKNIKELRHATALAKELSAHLQQHAHIRGKDLQEARNLYRRKHKSRRNPRHPEETMSAGEYRLRRELRECEARLSNIHERLKAHRASVAERRRRGEID